MEHRVSYILIYYRGHLYKGVKICYATGTIFQQKHFVLMNKIFIMNNVIRFKQ
jgi:hypothetical protein